MLLDGKRQCERYYHRSNNSGLTSTEIEKLLSLNALGNSWHETEQEWMFALVKPCVRDLIAVGLYLRGASPPIFAVTAADFAKKAGLPPVVRLPGTEQASPAR